MSLTPILLNHAQTARRYRTSVAGITRPIIAIHACTSAQAVTGMRLPIEAELTEQPTLQCVRAFHSGRHDRQAERRTSLWLGEERYAEWVSTSTQPSSDSGVAISLHCCATTSVGSGISAGAGGLAVTGTIRQARTGGALRSGQDAGAAWLASHEPHASCRDCGRKIERDDQPEHSWTGSNGRSPGGSAWTSTPRISPIPWRPTVTP